VVFAVRGLVRGSVRQVFGILGFVVGLWAAVMVSRWVGAQWLGARPAAVLWVSRLLVAGIAGLVVAGLFHWCGSLLGMAVQAGPAGWLDRVLGMALGAAIGMAWALALVLLLFFVPERVGTRRWVTEARTAHALVGMGTHACGWIEPRAPMLHGLGRTLRDVQRRLRVEPPTPVGADSRSS
jgi:uncharacterized membrane protein required for colicin V production